MTWLKTPQIQQGWLNLVFCSSVVFDKLQCSRVINLLKMTFYLNFNYSDFGCCDHTMRYQWLKLFFFGSNLYNVRRVDTIKEIKNQVNDLRRIDSHGRFQILLISFRQIYMKVQKKCPNLKGEIYGFFLSTVYIVLFLPKLFSPLLTCKRFRLVFNSLRKNCEDRTIA